MYLPSFTSDNTPWFFNGIRLQVFTSDKLKIEPWLINGWQTYGKFNELPGFGAQILYRPVEWFSVLSNDYAGWDTQDNAGRFRFHSDKSVEVREFNVDAKTHFFHRAAFSITGDIGGESGDGVTPFGGHHDASGTGASCTISSPCEQHFLSWMAYHRVWFANDNFAFTFGGGMMNNPGRYLVLAPTGIASPFQAASVQGIQYSSPSTNLNQAFSLAPGTTSSTRSIGSSDSRRTCPPSSRRSTSSTTTARPTRTTSAGHGGVTSPDGYATTAVPTGWRPDLVKSDSRIIAALLLRF